MPAQRDAYHLLEDELGHRFQDPSLLETALTHRSFLNEHPDVGRPDNERLELLGDAVLSLAVAHILMDAHPDFGEGELSRHRAMAVSEVGLAQVADQLHLGSWLFLGKGEEQTGGRRKPSLLADACEAVMGAVYLDGGFVAALTVVQRHFTARLAAAPDPIRQDHKTRLQERVQMVQHSTPRYAVVAEEGPDHDKVFEVAVAVDGEELARGTGRSKKEAEQQAAAAALETLAAAPNPPEHSHDELAEAGNGVGAGAGDEAGSGSGAPAE